MEFDPDRLEEFFSVFEAAQPRIRDFEGCHHVSLKKDSSHENVYYTLSGWVNEAALEKYRLSELFSQTWKKTKVCFNGKPMAFSLVDQ